jgi:hypothetical protein
VSRVGVIAQSEQVPEAVDCIALHFPEHVDVDRARHADRAMPQQVLDRLKINALGVQEPVRLPPVYTLADGSPGQGESEDRCP